MGLWGVLWELAKAVVPHAAPHVARAVVDAAKERRAAGEAAATRVATEPSNQDLAGALAYLEHRLSAAEERAAAGGEKLSLVEARMEYQWATARKWAIALLAWNALVTAALILLIILLARR